MLSAPLFVGGASSASWISIASEDGSGNNDTVTCSAPRFVEGLDEAAQHRIEQQLGRLAVFGLNSTRSETFGRIHSYHLASERPDGRA
jgi:hypothetical protein